VPETIVLVCGGTCVRLGTATGAVSLASSVMLKSLKSHDAIPMTLGAV
jgi:hypothetical protein